MNIQKKDQLPWSFSQFWHLKNLTGAEILYIQFWQLIQNIIKCKVLKGLYTTRISGPYGPLILALAEGWLASLTRGFATLNHWRGLRPFSFLKSPFLITYIQYTLCNLYYISFAYWWLLRCGNIKLFMKAK